MSGVPLQMGQGANPQMGYAVKAVTPLPAARSGASTQGGNQGQAQAGLGGVAQRPNQAAGRETLVPVRSSEEWLGVNLRVHPRKLMPLESPFALNFEGISEAGSVSVRGGLCKAVTHATNSDGLSLAFLRFRSSGTAAMLVVSENTGAAVLQGVAQKVLPPKTNPPLSKANASLSSAGGDFDVDIPALSPNPGVSQVVVRYSSDGFPLSPWDLKDRRSSLGQSFAWNGAGAFSETLDPPAAMTVGTKLYVTIWLVNALGFAPAWRGVVTLAS